jgi:hypothetical protein
MLSTVIVLRSHPAVLTHPPAVAAPTSVVALKHLIEWMGLNELIESPVVQTSGLESFTSGDRA